MLKSADEFMADARLDAEIIVDAKVEAPSRVWPTFADDGLGQPPASMLDDLHDMGGHSNGKYVFYIWDNGEYKEIPGLGS